MPKAAPAPSPRPRPAGLGRARAPISEQGAWEPFLAAFADRGCASLFEAAPEPVLIIDAIRGSIVNANVAAARLLQRRRSELVGTLLARAFDSASHRVVENSIAAALVHGVARTGSIRVPNTAVVLVATLSLVRVAGKAYMLSRFRTLAEDAESDMPHLEAPAMSEAIENNADAFALTDSELRVEYANRAFLQMIELDSTQEVCGRSLTRWLGLTQDDLGRMRRQMAARESVSSLITTLLSGQSAPRDVEALAIAVPDGPDTCWGFSIRERSALN